MQNGMAQDAALRNLEIMGESVRKLPDAWKQTQPQVEWGKVGDGRNVHAPMGGGQHSLDAVTRAQVVSIIVSASLP